MGLLGFCAGGKDRDLNNRIGVEFIFCGIFEGGFFLRLVFFIIGFNYFSRDLGERSEFRDLGFVLFMVVNICDFGGRVLFFYRLIFILLVY